MEMNFNKVVTSRYGACIYNTNDIYVGKSIELYGEYCDEEARILNDICRLGDVVVEVGANIGTHTVAMAKKVGSDGKVFAFEPQRLVFQTLCGNLAINSITNTFAYPYGVGEVEAEIFLTPLDYTKIGNFGGVTLDNTKEVNQKTEKVSIVTLDNFLEIDSLRLLKIDVEGMEKEVLVGAKNTIVKHKPIIYIENDRIEKSKELIEYLWSLGYELYWDIPKLFNPNNFFGVKENKIGNYVSVNMLCVEKSSKTTVNNFVKVEDSSYHPMAKNKK